MGNNKGNTSEQIQDLLKQINLNTSHILVREIDISPLTAHQMYIMKIIKKNPETNLTSLCNELSLSKGSMSLTINRLVEEGYVLRKESALDRRNINLDLTAKGEEILDYTVQKSMQIFADITASLSNEELEEIKQSLKKLNQSIHKAVHEHDNGNQVHRYKGLIGNNN